ncbi:MAG: hypothetical protein JW740_00855 [Candidatus Zambryskibacteria bacterium]|nr:hypothetical protein [Candidatus Zambryskibacteria bacterium]
MDILVLTSKILGVYLVISGLFLVIKTKTVHDVLKDFFKHPATTYLTGIILIFLSTMYLIQYNLWVKDWITVVTVFAWLVLLKGLTYVFIPGTLKNMVVKNKSWFKFWGLLSIIIGIYLFFFIV